MNEEEMRQLREQMEVRIVALLLGEASAFETAEIEQAMQKDSELAAFHAQMRRTIDLTREASKQLSAPTQPAAEPLKLSPERREALLAHFKRGKEIQVTPSRPPRGRGWLIPASLAAGILIFIGILAVPRFEKARNASTSMRASPQVDTLENGRQALALLNEEIPKAPNANTVEMYSKDALRASKESAMRGWSVERNPFLATPSVVGDSVRGNGLSISAGKPQLGLQGTAPTFSPPPAEHAKAENSAPKVYLPPSRSSSVDELAHVTKSDLEVHRSFVGAEFGDAEVSTSTRSGVAASPPPASQPGERPKGESDGDGDVFKNGLGFGAGHGGIGGGGGRVELQGLTTTTNALAANFSISNYSAADTGIVAPPPLAAWNEWGLAGQPVVRSSNTPMLGEIPIAGRLFRSESAPGLKDGLATYTNGREVKIRNSGEATVTHYEALGTMAPSGNLLSYGLNQSEGSQKIAPSDSNGTASSSLFAKAPPSPPPAGPARLTGITGFGNNTPRAFPDLRDEVNKPQEPAVGDPIWIGVLDNPAREIDALVTADDNSGERNLLKLPARAVRPRENTADGDKSAANTFVKNGKLLYEAGKLEEAEANLTQAITSDPQNKTSYYYLDLIREQRHRKENLAREEKSKQWLLEVDKAWRGDAGQRTLAGETKPEASPEYVGVAMPPGLAAKGREILVSKLDKIRLKEFQADGLPLTEVIKQLNDEARKQDSTGRGVNVLLSRGADSETLHPPIDPGTGLPGPSAAEPVDLSATTIKIMPPLTDITLRQALDAVRMVADRPINYSVEDYAVVFSPKVPEKKITNDVAVPKVSSIPATPQPEISTRENAFSTFSLNVSDVCFKLAAASLENNTMPEPASIRVEEFVNAFNYHDPAPQGKARLAFAWERARYPFAHNRDIVRFSIQTAARGREPQKPLNLVILLDNSGSMERPDRVQIVHEALKVLAQQLQPQDRISVVAFARTARLCVDGMAGGKPKDLLDKVLDLNPDGGTNLEEALGLGYSTAAKHFLASGMNRVIVLTDGAANLGNVEPEALKQQVVTNRIKGIALDCFGIGWEGYNDDLLEVLSHNGDGRYGFLDDPAKAGPEFANQLAGALNVEAADVKTQVEFNPRRVLTWRQIGYAKHQLTKEQFRDNKVDAAELAASESGNALYAIEVNPQGSGPLGVVRVRYKVPATGEYVEQSWGLPYQSKAPALDEASPAMRLAVSAAAFGEWLARSPYAGEITPGALLPYLNSVCETYAPDSRPQRLVSMIRQAVALSGK